MKKIFAIALSLFFCFGASAPLFAKDMELTGAGATFPYPLYSKMFDEYHQLTGIKVNYQAIGSGGGQRQLLNKTVDFGASDAFMTNQQLAKVPAKLVHIPTCMGAVVLSYNLPGNPTLKLTSDIIADIYLGTITNWNDRRIAKLNPRLSLPDSMITTVHRSDGSGTNAIFTHYLSEVSPKWRKEVGEGLSVSWPNGLGGKGNPGVAGLVQQTPGSFGYIELIYAVQNHLPYALLKNKDGKWIKASLAAVTTAGNIPNIPDDTRVFITNSSAKDGYPISGMTWLLVYQNQNYGGRSKAEAAATVRLLWWMTHQGQKYAKALDYAPLSGKIVAKVDKILRSVKYGGAPLLAAQR